jgi:hypothetical protein
MEITTFVIDEADPWYCDAAQVLIKSQQERSPNTPIEIVSVPLSHPDTATNNLVANVCKTKAMKQVVHAAPAGAILGFIDADAMVLRDISDAEDLLDDCDIVLTSRGRGNVYDFNSGVLFMKVSWRVKNLLTAWEHQAELMLEDVMLFSKYHKKYGGINQSALGSLIETDQLGGVIIKRVPNREWNALNADHGYAIEQSRIVHVLGPLRRSIRHEDKTPRESLKGLIDLWKGWHVQVTER